jgi:hypothetical protein
MAAFAYPGRGIFLRVIKSHIGKLVRAPPIERPFDFRLFLQNDAFFRNPCGAGVYV